MILQDMASLFSLISLQSGVAPATDWPAGLQELAMTTIGVEATRIAELVENGDVYWLTVLGQNGRGGKPGIGALEAWYEDYPDPEIPVLGDEALDSNGYGLSEKFIQYAWPTMMLLDENMVITHAGFSESTYTQALDQLEDKFAAGDFD